LTLYGVNASMRLPKALHELLKMIIMQTLVCRQVLVVIRQRNKTIVCIPTCLMQTPNRPLARTLKPTSYALTAWQREAAHNIVPGAHRKQRPLLPFSTPITGGNRARYSRQPPRIGLLRILADFVRIEPLRNFLAALYLFIGLRRIIFFLLLVSPSTVTSSRSLCRLALNGLAR
jgi:hypothetical protein